AGQPAPGRPVPQPTDVLKSSPPGLLGDPLPSAAPPAAGPSAGSSPSAKPSAGGSPGAGPSSGSSPSAGATPGSAQPDSAAEAAIKRVIELGNRQQEQAISQRNPALMKSTATDGYYEELVQINQDLLDGGVGAIKLLELTWGPITLTGSDTAEATTHETWRTTYSDGATDESTDRNVYTLVRQAGGWLIQRDAHPDDQLDQPGGQAPPGAGPPPQTPVPAAPAGRGESHNWSGYSATGGSFTSVAATWLLPRPAAGTFGVDAAWLGIGGVHSRDLIQAGTEATVSGSRVRYQAWVEVLPQVSHPVPLAVKPGDSVSVSIAEQQAGSWLVDFKNNTSGQTYEVQESYHSSHSSAEWIEEAPSGRRGVLPLDDFGQIQFSNASTVKDGKTVTIAGAGGKPVTMIDAAGKRIAIPSKLGSDGASFTVARQGATPPDGTPRRGAAARR
ncbi:MAG: hypothetical protein KGJ86_12365, partial [Chloroflexota bacterium]|nr:hypothetical protein [Chloroflexota bacterium]